MIDVAEADVARMTGLLVAEALMVASWFDRCWLALADALNARGSRP